MLPEETRMVMRLIWRARAAHLAAGHPDVGRVPGRYAAGALPAAGETRTPSECWGRSPSSPASYGDVRAVLADWRPVPGDAPSRLARLARLLMDPDSECGG